MRRSTLAPQAAASRANLTRRSSTTSCRSRKRRHGAETRTGAASARSLLCDLLDDLRHALALRSTRPRQRAHTSRSSQLSRTLIDDATRCASRLLDDELQRADDELPTKGATASHRRGWRTCSPATARRRPCVVRALYTGAAKTAASPLASAPCVLCPRARQLSGKQPVSVLRCRRSRCCRRHRGPRWIGMHPRPVRTSPTSSRARQALTRLTSAHEAAPDKS